MKLKIWLGRIIPLVIIALGEVGLYCILFKWLTTSFVFIEVVLHILSVLIILNIVRTSRHLSSDLMWILLIMLFPVFGTFVYVLMLLSLLFGKTFRNIIQEQKKASSYYIQDASIIDEIRKDNKDYVSQLAFLSEEGFPFYHNTGFEYYAPCENGFDEMLKELKKAEKYIFMEYFIIEEGIMFNSILSILEEKVKQGVEVRIMYDDMGSLGTLPASYAKQLEKKGIKAVSFNRISPIINTIMNHRDHRKILVIDGSMGQDAINVITGFNEALDLTGCILTKLDGNTKGGVALSVRHLTHIPIKFVGTSEKMDGLSEFYPERMAERILDMGDILEIVNKVEDVIDEDEAKKQAIKMKKGTYDLEDFLANLKQIKKLGPLENILKMLPQARKMGLNNVAIDPKDLAHVEAIISSMTIEERRKPEILKATRKQRIAKGSGRSVEEVNRLLKQFEMMKDMMKKMSNGNMPF